MKFVIIAITLLSVSSIVLSFATRRTVKNTGFFDVLLGKSSEFKKSIKKWCGKETATLVFNGKAPVQNGCGPAFLDKAGLTKLTKTLGGAINGCCNVHDVCYGTCVTKASGDSFREKKKQCDTDMSECIQKIQDGQGKGSIRALVSRGILHTAVKYLGDGAFVDAQKDSCKCQ